MEGEVRSFGLAKKPIARNLPVLALLETHSYLNHHDSFRCCFFFRYYLASDRFSLFFEGGSFREVTYGRGRRCDVLEALGEGGVI